MSKRPEHAEHCDTASSNSFDDDLEHQNRRLRRRRWRRARPATKRRSRRVSGSATTTSRRASRPARRPARRSASGGVTTRRRRSARSSAAPAPRLVRSRERDRLGAVRRRRAVLSERRGRRRGCRAGAARASYLHQRSLSKAKNRCVLQNTRCKERHAVLFVSTTQKKTRERRKKKLLLTPLFFGILFSWRSWYCWRSYLGMDEAAAKVLRNTKTVT